MKRIRRLFVSGLLAIIPIALTFYLLFWLVSSADNILRIPIESLLGTYFPGMGFFSLIIIIFLVGLFTSNVLGRWVMKLINNSLSKAPLIKNIYGSLLQIMQTFTKGKNKSFSKVVVVNFPNEVTKSVGFITNEEITFSHEELVSIFIPTTPNPSNGFLIMVKKGDYTEVTIPVDQALKMIVSMGTLLPEHLQSE